MDGWRVLLVEDERLLDRVVTEALRTASLTCEVARTGKEALEWLQTRSYDLVLLDLQLPDTTGDEVLRQLRAQFPQLPVVLITAYSAAEELGEARLYAPDAFLAKPFDLDTLLATVWNLLRRGTRAPHTHAVVSMPSQHESAPVPSLPSGGDLITLLGSEVKLVGRVVARDDYLLSVRTELVSNAPSKGTLWVEWVGADALYRFRSRIARQVVHEDTLGWYLHLPRLIHRVQRRRHPRLSAEGQVMLAVAGRIQRSVRGQLLDLSREGIGVSVPISLNRGASVLVSVEWHSPEGLESFQSEGTVRHVVAYAEEGVPRYQVGIQLLQVPRKVQQLLEKCHYARLGA